jgi:hypothetical protein
MTQHSSTASSIFLSSEYKRFDQLPLSVLDELPFSVYIVDYNWVYRFINRSARQAFGALADKLIGQNVFEVFRDKRFEQIFLGIKGDVDRRVAIHKIVESPLRGSQVILKGIPLEDCYYFTATIVPAKIEVLNELRDELNKRKSKA